MLSAFRVIRFSKIIKGQEEKHVELVRAAIVEARRTLADNPCPDTFLGRKTQEPFPNEGEMRGRLSQGRLS